MTYDRMGYDKCQHLNSPVFEGLTVTGLETGCMAFYIGCFQAITDRCHPVILLPMDYVCHTGNYVRITVPYQFIAADEGGIADKKHAQGDIP